MNSHKEALGAPTFGNEVSKKYVKGILGVNLKVLDINNSISVSGFFNSLNIVLLPHLGLEKEFSEQWNKWINEWKIHCVGKSRSNAIKKPLLNLVKFNEFIKTLIDLDLLDPSSELIQEISRKISEILNTKN